MRVKEWLPVWLQNYVKPTAKEKTYIRYSEVVTHHLIPRIGELEMSEVTPLTLQQMVTELSAHGNLRTGGRLSANTVNAIVTVIQAALQVAYRLGYLPEYTADTTLEACSASNSRIRSRRQEYQRYTLL